MPQLQRAQAGAAVLSQHYNARRPLRELPLLLQGKGPSATRLGTAQTAAVLSRDLLQSCHGHNMAIAPSASRARKLLHANGCAIAGRSTLKLN